MGTACEGTGRKCPLRLRQTRQLLVIQRRAESFGRRLQGPGLLALPDGAVGHCLREQPARLRTFRPGKPGGRHRPVVARIWPRPARARLPVARIGGHSFDEADQRGGVGTPGVFLPGPDADIDFGGRELAGKVKPKLLRTRRRSGAGLALTVAPFGALAVMRGARPAVTAGAIEICLCKVQGRTLA
jgi:hypothetical protein